MKKHIDKAMVNAGFPTIGKRAIYDRLKASSSD
jgi:hypothetical protein